MSNNRYERSEGSRWERFADFLRSLDARSWVVIGLMFGVLTAMMGVNAYAWMAFLPFWVAASLSGFMEIGALGWKFADERPQNSTDQQKLTTWIVWLNVGFAVILLITNLMRIAFHIVTGEQAQMAFSKITGWDYVAFVLVALSALSHIGGALLFRQWDEQLENARTIAKQTSKARFEKEWNDGVLADLEQRLAQRQEVLQKLDELRKKYAHLPPNELRVLLDEAKNALEQQFHVDADGDGRIGNGQRPQSPVTAPPPLNVPAPAPVAAPPPLNVPAPAFGVQAAAPMPQPLDPQ